MNKCSFCGCENQTMVATPDDSAAICEVCVRNLVAYFDYHRKAWVEKCHETNPPQPILSYPRN